MLIYCVRCVRCQLLKGRNFCLLCSLLCPQLLEQGLAQRDSERRVKWGWISKGFSYQPEELNCLWSEDTYGTGEREVSSCQQKGGLARARKKALRPEKRTGCGLGEGRREAFGTRPKTLTWELGSPERGTCRRRPQRGRSTEARPQGP